MATTQKLSMRDQMVATIAELFERDERTALILAAVSATQFAPILQRYPQRALNLGIMEQSMIGVAAGFALEGFIPFAHTITPFLVERPLEQLKDDFCYQGLGGNFLSIGASYDYSTDGSTHHGPADVPLLMQLPGMQIVVPGTAHELDQLLQAAYANGSPTYYRTSVAEHNEHLDIEFGKLKVIKRGSQATVIAVGPSLEYVLPAVEGLDVTLLYCTTVAPFDKETLRAHAGKGEIVVVEPYYEGALVPDISAALEDIPTRVKAIGVPRQFLHRYGTLEQYNAALELTPEEVRQRIEQFL
ncbi:transketolase [Ktedonobacter sp. SOSP1-85]|uniref:transketolase family protein n=1 Tax=Ktedonobacter sp. SOSP1-85 TaxID=2778367 RepID=UPI001916A9D3|nr:transketolase C-terminal domain-containing protein [Ktedonobacter sp. SOSP1-85]GHO81279.1 transketolase [Ktedonobacter sp. SOSP1-85]